MRTWWIGIAATAAWAPGCSVPEGRFACATTSDCPSGQVCRASDHRCWRTPDETSDSGIAPGDAGARDAAPHDGSDDANIPAIDAALPDAGGSSCPVDPDSDGVCGDVLSAGYTTCAIRPAGNVQCWGFNDQHLLLGDNQIIHENCGDGTRDCSRSPVDVEGIDDAVQLTGGDPIQCARRATSGVYCWGLDVTSSSGAPFGAPTSIPGTTSARFVGARYPLAIVNNFGGVAVGGIDVQGNGVYGDGVLHPADSRRGLGPISTLSGITSLDVGWYHLCASDGTTVWCWGKNNNGEIGDGAPPGSRPSPTAVVGDLGGPVVSLAVGDAYSCALLATGRIRCWGSNGRGQLGAGPTPAGLPSSNTPLEVQGITSAVEIDGGFGFVCARLGDGHVWCWGEDGNGQLGDPAGHTACTPGVLCSSVPVEVEGIASAVDIVAGTRHACALLIDGSIRCWGLNAHGQLGDGTFVDRSTPVAVIGLD